MEIRYDGFRSGIQRREKGLQTFVAAKLCRLLYKFSVDRIQPPMPCEMSSTAVQQACGCSSVDSGTCHFVIPRV